MTEFRYELKIPKERIAILIGKKGKIKKEIEEETKTKIDVDSKEGDVFIIGDDGLDLYNAKEVIVAIGRGFNPEIAKLLLKPDYCFESINIKDFAGKSKDVMTRLKGRVIGKEGKSRKIIEELTECHISVYGKTVSMVGNVDYIVYARTAIESLLRGSTHANVFRFLEKKRREIKRERILGKEL